MTSAFEPVLNEMMAEIQKQRDELMRLQREMPEISGSARSKRRQVSATVDARGEVVELQFHGTGYRSLAPAELANIIVETIREARAEAQQHLWEVVGHSFPDGMGFAELADGTYDWTDPLSLPKPLLDLLHSPPTPWGSVDAFEETLGSLLFDDTDPEGGPTGEAGTEPGEGVAERPDSAADGDADPGPATEAGKHHRPRDE
jgi:DNA-binding protein YbaB